MKVHRDIQQNSVDWQLIRAGKITASEADALISPTGKVRTGEGVKTYLAQKLCERWTGGPLLQLQGIFDVEQGQILEERAKPAFTFHTGIEIENVAFIETDDSAAGCSPDGLIGDTSGCEIKCPALQNQMKYLLDGKLPEIYVAQVQFSMWITDCPTWHFFSYNRSLPPLHLVIERDEKYQDSIETAVSEFTAQLNAAWDKLCFLNGGPPKVYPRSQPKPEFVSQIPS